MRRIRKLLLLAVGVVFAGSAQALADGRSPSSLYRALLTTPIPATSLPRGFSSARVVSTSTGGKGKQYHVIGALLIFANVANGGAEVIYGVFPTRRDALDAALPFPALPTKTSSRRPLPNSLPGPGEITIEPVSENLLRKRVTTWFTGIEFVDGNVLVSVRVGTASSTATGDIPSSTRLAQFAHEHLRALRGA